MKEIDVSGIGKINFKILNPGGNKTALVHGIDYSSKQKSIINNSIMEKFPDVEQVGFISDKETRLEMAGGEFCLNASRCAIYEYSKNGNVVKLKVSGMDKTIIGKTIGKNEVELMIDISKDRNKLMKRQDKYWSINIDGILIVVVNDAKEYINKLKQDESKAKQEIKQLMMEEFNTKEKAIGMMFLENEPNGIKINPVVWVKDIDTTFYETACGSGSLGTAIYNYYINGEDSINIIQPSGYRINIRLNTSGQTINSAQIRGIVEEK